MYVFPAHFLLQTVWKDPVCGDGMCEAPFEFASFSRFGCKADCGRLSDIQNLTAAQVDIYWDFTHQAASLPASVGTNCILTEMKFAVDEQQSAAAFVTRSVPLHYACSMPSYLFAVSWAANAYGTPHTETMI